MGLHAVCREPNGADWPETSSLYRYRILMYSFFTFVCVRLATGTISVCTSVFLRFFVETIYYVCHDIAWQGVVVSLCSSLRIYDLADVAQVVEDVEAIDGNGDACLGESL